MIIQLSSGQGPAECELAVRKLYDSLKKEYPDIQMISCHEAKRTDGYTRGWSLRERDKRFLRKVSVKGCPNWTPHLSCLLFKSCRNAK